MKTTSAVWSCLSLFSIVTRPRYVVRTNHLLIVLVMAESTIVDKGLVNRFFKNFQINSLNF